MKGGKINKNYLKGIYGPDQAKKIAESTSPEYFIAFYEDNPGLDIF